MRGHKILGIIIIVVGLSILFSFPVFNFIFAFIILWIGVRILTGQSRIFGGAWTSGEGQSDEDYYSRVLIFSGVGTKLTSSNFKGMDVVSIFGGGDIDVMGVKTGKSEIDFELNAIFGGLKIKVPQSWRVVDEGTGILGGFDNKTTPPSKASVTVHVKGAAIFGGVEIIN